jgi:D-alanyl-D-alanine carboxypeptidase (penicillin-binding protein 5/6)
MITKNKIVLKKKKCYERFILEMNKRARALGMAKTTYANSHGLSNNLNKSCAFDLCILCEYAMTNEKFRKVVSKIDYKCQIQYEIIAEDKQKHGKHVKM